MKFEWRKRVPKAKVYMSAYYKRNTIRLSPVIIGRPIEETLRNLLHEVAHFQMRESGAIGKRCHAKPWKIRCSQLVGNFYADCKIAYRWEDELG